VPYVACPADPAAIAAGVVPFDSGSGVLHFAPGIIQPGNTPDVMRGEEAQIIGALEMEPGLSRDSLLVLPGTHCKWAHVRGGRVERFTTYLTGELFAMLRDHSIIGRPARDLAPADLPAGGEAFVRGVRAARESGSAGVAGRLFTTRSLYLTGALPVEETLDYLSGLLVGEEIRSVLAEHGGGTCPPCVLLGDPALCDRYRLALETFGIDDVRKLDDTGPAGLWRIATAAGLVHPTARSAAAGRA
jgi:2-dehydro-3-deoxygalactonokinase